MVQVDTFETNEEKEQINQFELFDLDIQSPIKKIVPAGKHFFIICKLHIIEVDADFEHSKLTIINIFDIKKYFGAGFKVSKPLFTHNKKSLYCLVQSKTSSAIIWIYQNDDSTRFSIFSFEKKINLIHVNMNNEFNLFAARNKQLFNLNVQSIIETVSPVKSEASSDGKWKIENYGDFEEHLSLLCTVKSRINYIFFNEKMTIIFLILKSTNRIIKFEYSDDTTTAKLIKEIQGFRLEAKLIRFSNDLSIMIRYHTTRA